MSATADEGKLLNYFEDILPELNLQRKLYREHSLSSAVLTSDNQCHLESVDQDCDDDKRPAFISVPGRIFPVEEFWLEDVIEKTGYTLLGDEVVSGA